MSESSRKHRWLPERVARDWSALASVGTVIAAAGDRARMRAACSLCLVIAIATTACLHSLAAVEPASPPVPSGPPPTGTVQGRVLWNEQPIAGARVVATSEYNMSSTHYGEARTDGDGRFSLSGVPAGRKYLYVFGTGAPFWVAAVTPFDMAADQGTVATDTYLCKGFDPVSPGRRESLATNRPELRWDPYPDATEYAVRVLRTGQNSSSFSRGDNDPHLKDTTVRVEPGLSAGEYTWRVDAFNRAGHIIGCSFYPRVFKVASQPVAAGPDEAIAPLSPQVDPDHAIYGMPLGTSHEQFVNAYGEPTGELRLSPSDTVLLYGRSHAFYFERDRLVGAFLRSGGFILDFRLTDRLTGTTRFDSLGWRLPNGIENGMTLTTIRNTLGDKLLGCAAGRPGVPRCYFTTDTARVDLDFVPRSIAGSTGDDVLIAVGIIVRSNR